MQRFRCPQCGKTYTETHTRLFGTMTVPEDKALLAIQLLIEGTSIRSAERITGLHRDTIMRLLVLAGERCIQLLECTMQNLKCKRIQSDEIWTYCQKKQRHVNAEDSPEVGDAWVFVALDAETKLIPAYTVGKRNRETTYQFLTSLRNRIAPEHRFQITTDGFHFYRKGVEDVFAGQADFAQMIKLYGDYGQHDSAGKYSPSPMIETIVKICDGRPDPRHISTSYVERQNMTIRQSIRRFTRLTNAFSKKLDNLKAACALHFAYYDFARIHQTLRCTPAMEAGLTDHIWTLRELLATQH
ncbi:MAG TPA: IS1 family transposase [Terriglobales bacterium]|nr:IS1 family transposase [Terriglobales bacterium]